MAGPVGGLRKHPYGRVDQLEDRYLGMVEAPSSNLGTSTRNESKQVCWTVLPQTCNAAFRSSLLARHDRFIAQHLGRWLGTSTSLLPIEVNEVERAAKTVVLLIASVVG